MDEVVTASLGATASRGLACQWCRGSPLSLLPPLRASGSASTGVGAAGVLLVWRLGAASTVRAKRAVRRRSPQRAKALSNVLLFLIIGVLVAVSSAREGSVTPAGVPGSIRAGAASPRPLFLGYAAPPRHRRETRRTHFQRRQLSFFARRRRLRRVRRARACHKQPWTASSPASRRRPRTSPPWSAGVLVPWCPRRRSAGGGRP